MNDLFSHPESGGYNMSGWTKCGGDGGRRVSAAHIDVEEMGVYRVTVRADGAGFVFGQRRNLMSVCVSGGEISFLTCLTEYMPSMSNETVDQKRLFASCTGADIRITDAEKTEARRIFIAGDSTLADQSASAPYYPYDSYCGWGQMLPVFLPEDAVCNQAHSGLTSRCFVTDGHFDIVKAHIRKGDLLLIQFGHNDQKRRALQAHREYPMYLQIIAGEALKAGAVPVIVSPICRAPVVYEKGKGNLLYAHARAAERAAVELGIPFIDLNEYSGNLFLEMGEACRMLFKPGDITHTNDYGAYRMAKYIAESLDKMGLANCAHVQTALDHADDRQTAPAHAQASRICAAYRDIDCVENREIVEKAVGKGLLDPCVLYMHPFDTLSRAEFIQKMLRVMKISGIHGGDIPFRDVSADEFDASFARACRERCIVTGEYYRPDDPVTRREAAELVMRAGGLADFSGEGEYPNRYEIVKALLTLCRS